MPKSNIMILNVNFFRKKGFQLQMQNLTFADSVSTIFISLIQVRILFVMAAAFAISELLINLTTQEFFDYATLHNVLAIEEKIMYVIR